MSTAGIVILVVVLVVVAAVAIWLTLTQLRRKRLQQRFGPEYDRTLEERDDRRTAERELADREKRHADFDIQPLSEPERRRFATEWTLIQERFVDHPGKAVAEADRLVTVVMGERGYPTEGYQQQVSDLSVRHGSTLDHYRTAHDIKSRNDESRASTEDLRAAMVHYRSLFEDLLGKDGDQRDRNGGGLA
jgi:hypothetical protein